MGKTIIILLRRDICIKLFVICDFRLKSLGNLVILLIFFDRFAAGPYRKLNLSSQTPAMLTFCLFFYNRLFHRNRIMYFHFIIFVIIDTFTFFSDWTFYRCNNRLLIGSMFRYLSFLSTQTTLLRVIDQFFRFLYHLLYTQHRSVQLSDARTHVGGLIASKTIRIHGGRELKVYRSFHEDDV